MVTGGGAMAFILSPVVAATIGEATVVAVAIAMVVRGFFAVRHRAKKTDDSGICHP